MADAWTSEVETKLEPVNMGPREKKKKKKVKQSRYTPGRRLGGERV
jgi:hypothetical protein